MYFFWKKSKFLPNAPWKKFATPWKKFADRPSWYPPNHHTFRNFLPDPPSMATEKSYSSFIPHKTLLSNLLHLNFSEYLSDWVFRLKDSQHFSIWYSPPVNYENIRDRYHLIETVITIWNMAHHYWLSMVERAITMRDKKHRCFCISETVIIIWDKANHDILRIWDVTMYNLYVQGLRSIFWICTRWVSLRKRACLLWGCSQEQEKGKENSWIIF